MTLLQKKISQDRCNSANVFHSAFSQLVESRYTFSSFPLDSLKSSKLIAVDASEIRLMAPLEVGPLFGSWTSHYLHTGFYLMNIQNGDFTLARFLFNHQQDSSPPLKSSWVSPTWYVHTNFSGNRWRSIWYQVPSVTVIFWWIFLGLGIFEQRIWRYLQKMEIPNTLLTSGCFFGGGGNFEAYM